MANVLRMPRRAHLRPISGYRRAAATARSIKRCGIRQTLIYRCLFGRSLAEADDTRPRREGRRALDLVRSLAAIAKAAGPDERGDSRSALIVGGDVGQRRFCAALLGGLGLRVDVATGGLQALRAIRGSRFGMVIVDATTADIEAGFWSALIEALMGADAARPPHLYVVTDGDGATPAMLRRLGAHRSLSRPVRALSLVEAIERLR
jgi:CheY-like chemotaxis protein